MGSSVQFKRSSGSSAGRGSVRISRSGGNTPKTGRQENRTPSGLRQEGLTHRGIRYLQTCGSSWE